jgi:hypothetical protein
MKRNANERRAGNQLLLLWETLKTQVSIFRGQQYIGNFSENLMTAYEAGTLPYFIRWTIVLFRTLEMSLMVPEHSDLLVHVPGEVQAMMEVQLPITRALYDLTMEIMEDRDQRVLFVPYRYINLRRITSVHFNTS